MSDVNLEQLVKMHNDLIVQRTLLEAELDEKLKPVKEKLSKIETIIMMHFNETGQESAKTKYGTPYKSKTISATVTDANVFYNFIVETGNWDLLQKRVSTTVYQQLKDDGVHVPGIKTEQRLSIKIRKS